MTENSSTRPGSDSHPGDGCAGQVVHLLITQVHQEPVGEHHIVAAGGQGQLGDIRHLEVHMGQMTVDAPGEKEGRGPKQQKGRRVMDARPYAGEVCRRVVACPPAARDGAAALVVVLSCHVPAHLLQPMAPRPPPPTLPFCSTLLQVS